MNHSKSGADLKSEAREILMGKYTPFAIALLSVLCSAYFLNFAVTFVTTLLVSITLQTETALADGSFSVSIWVELLRFSLNGCIWVMITLMAPGICLFCLKLKNNVRILAYSDFFFGYQHNFKKSLAVSMAFCLPKLVLLEPFSYFYEKFNYTGSFLSLKTAGICLILGLLFCIPIDLYLSMSFFIMLDFPQYSAKEVLSMSVRTARANAKRLFRLQLSFLPVLLLCACSLGIGLLWAVPYIAMTYAGFYLDMMRPKKDDAAI